MVPGTAFGVLIGDLAYTWLALRLMRRTGRDDVTAMPFGIDTPTLFAMVFGVLGPVKTATGDADLAWKVGMGVTIAIGVAKTALAFAGDWTRRVVPRAALLGSIAGIAVLLIAFLPALKLFRDPLVGLLALVVLLMALMGRVRMPFGMPGALAAALAGAAIFWMRAGVGGPGPERIAATRLGLAVPWPTLAWLDALDDVLPYLSVALPFADRHHHRRHRQHGVGGGRGRRVPRAGHPHDRGAGDDRRRPLRWRHPEHAVHRPSRLQGDGCARGLHARHRARHRRGSGRRCALVRRRRAARGCGGAHSCLHRPGNHRPGLPRVAAAPWRRRRAGLRPHRRRRGADPGRKPRRRARADARRPRW